MSFIQRLISVRFDLANGSFGSGGGNSLTLSGLRASCRILRPGGGTSSTVEGAIWGMSLSQMNQLSTIGALLNKQAENTVTVMAGDAQSGMAVVYKGTLFAAFVDAEAQPQVAFRFMGSAGQFEAVKPIPATSVQGSGDVAQIMQGLAQKMGFQFENNGVSIKLSNPYFYGSGRAQAAMLARHAGIEHVIERGTLAIWKPGQGRQGSGATMISPETGMVGYPAFAQPVVVVKTIFNPSILYGSTIQIQSQITPACGTWAIFNIEDNLDSMIPHGSWFSTIQATPMNAGSGSSGEIEP